MPRPDTPRWVRTGRQPTPWRAGLLALAALLLVAGPGPLWQGNASAPTPQHTRHPAAQHREVSAPTSAHAPAVPGEDRRDHAMRMNRSAKPAPVREHSLATWPRRGQGARHDR